MTVPPLDMEAFKPRALERAPVSALLHWAPLVFDLPPWSSFQDNLYGAIARHGVLDLVHVLDERLENSDEIKEFLTRCTTQKSIKNSRFRIEVLTENGCVQLSSPAPLKRLAWLRNFGGSRNFSLVAPMACWTRAPALGAFPHSAPLTAHDALVFPSAVARRRFERLNQDRRAYDATRQKLTAPRAPPLPPLLAVHLPAMNEALLPDLSAPLPALAENLPPPVAGSLPAGMEKNRAPVILAVGTNLTLRRLLPLFQALAQLTPDCAVIIVNRRRRPYPSGATTVAEDCESLARSLLGRNPWCLFACDDDRRTDDRLADDRHTARKARRTSQAAASPAPAAPDLCALADIFLALDHSLDEGHDPWLLQAMACALPIVAADFGALSEIIRPEREALLLPCLLSPQPCWREGRPLTARTEPPLPPAHYGMEITLGGEHLLAALRTLCRHEQARKRLGHAAAWRVRSALTWNHLARATQELWAELKEIRTAQAPAPQDTAMQDTAPQGTCALWIEPFTLFAHYAKECIDHPDYRLKAIGSQEQWAQITAYPNFFLPIKNAVLPLSSIQNFWSVLKKSPPQTFAQLMRSGKNDEERRLLALSLVWLLKFDLLEVNKRPPATAVKVAPAERQAAPPPSS